MPSLQTVLTKTAKDMLAVNASCRTLTEQVESAFGAQVKLLGAK